MRRPRTRAPAPSLATGGRGSWSCDAPLRNSLLDRARRIGAAETLDELDDLHRALESAWVHVQVSDADRLALLDLIARQRSLVQKHERPLARASARGLLHP